MTHRFFAYGTLKKNQYFHDKYLGDGKSKSLGKALCSLDYTLYIDGLPHLVKEKTDKPVKGELYEINDEVLASLDRLEGVPIFYRRELIDVLDESGARVLAWAYLRQKDFKGQTNCFIEDEYV